MPFFACGSAEGAFFFIRFGGFAAKTNEINVHFRAAAGGKGHFAGRPPFFACGSVDETMYFVCCGGEAATTNENSFWG
jgi:hypothetical protein